MLLRAGRPQPASREIFGDGRFVHAEPPSHAREGHSLGHHAFEQGAIHDAHPRTNFPANQGFRAGVHTGEMGVFRRVTGGRRADTPGGPDDRSSALPLPRPPSPRAPARRPGRTRTFSSASARASPLTSDALAPRAPAGSRAPARASSSCSRCTSSIAGFGSSPAACDDQLRQQRQQLGVLAELRLAGHLGHRRAPGRRRAGAAPPARSSSLEKSSLDVERAPAPTRPPRGEAMHSARNARSVSSRRESVRGARRAAPRSPSPRRPPRRPARGAARPPRGRASSPRSASSRARSPACEAIGRQLHQRRRIGLPASARTPGAARRSIRSRPSGLASSPAAEHPLDAEAHERHRARRPPLRSPPGPSRWISSAGSAPCRQRHDAQLELALRGQRRRRAASPPARRCRRRAPAAPSAPSAPARRPGRPVSAVPIRPDRVAHPRLVQRDHVRVALAQDHLARLRRVRARQMRAVQVPALVVDVVVGRVQVLRSLRPRASRARRSRAPARACPPAGT